MLPGAAQGPPGLSRWVRHGTYRCTLGLRGGQGCVPGPKKGHVLAGDTLGPSLCLKDGTGDRQGTASQDQGQAGGWQYPGGSQGSPCAGRWPGAGSTHLSQSVGTSSDSGDRGTPEGMCWTERTIAGLGSHPDKPDPPRGGPRANTEPRHSRGRSRLS